MSGYAFARLRFRGKKAMYSILVAVLMVPATITIVPQFIIVSKLGIINTYWALILPLYRQPAGAGRHPLPHRL